MRTVGLRLAVVAVVAVCAITTDWKRRLLAATGSSIEDRGRTQEPAPSQHSPYSIRWLPDTTGANRVIVEIIGISPATLARLRRSSLTPAAWQLLFSVAVEAQGKQETRSPKTLPMLGTYSILPGGLRFAPQYPLEPGLTYRAWFWPSRLPSASRREDLPISTTFRVPARASAPTTVVARIYPSADQLPENLLKFYLHFSAPMSRGHIYDHIHLLDSAGKAIELPFLEIDEELWDDAMTRLTLIIDPGRIKRGVLPLEDVGPALEEGKRYSLVIDRAWKDGSGNPLKESYQKSFQVGPADREPPDPGRWKIQPPPAGTRDALIVTFPEPMDHALSQRLILVTDASGTVVQGRAELLDEERRWSFTARTPWARGAYQLVIQTTIEDLAGNNIGKPFDVDVFESVQRRLTSASVKLPFEIR